MGARICSHTSDSGSLRVLHICGFFNRRPRSIRLPEIEDIPTFATPISEFVFGYDSRGISFLVLALYVYLAFGFLNEVKLPVYKKYNLLVWLIDI